jgi:ubiquinone/menaquinone biosynthesis C-methylase UbiE
MLLNRVEKALMNNPIRSFLQWRHEAATLERLGGKLSDLRVLELGCGRGVGTQIILERFKARTVHAFDLDPAMIKQARQRLAAYPAERVQVFVGDAEEIAAPNEAYDAVVDFGILHHVPNWQRAVAEVRRVLKPGGRFFFEEVTRQALERWVYRTFLQHPTENRFTAAQFVAELERQGIRVGNNLIEWFLGDFVLGVAQRSSR